MDYPGQKLDRVHRINGMRVFSNYTWTMITTGARGAGVR